MGRVWKSSSGDAWRLGGASDSNGSSRRTIRNSTDRLRGGYGNDSNTTRKQPPRRRNADPTEALATTSQESVVALNELKRAMMEEPAILESYMCTPCARLPKFGGGWGFACGYRSLQVMLSCARAAPMYRRRIWQETFQENPDTYLPTVNDIQRHIERAWALGWDAIGRLQLKYDLVGTRKWIGATDIATMLQYAGCRVRLFDSYLKQKAVHTTIMQRLWQHFERYGRAGHQDEADGAEMMRQCSDSDVCTPVHLQWQGHCVSVVGVCRVAERDGSVSERLVVIDTHNTGRNATIVNKFLWTEAHLNEANYQLVILDGIYEEEERPAVQERGFALTHLDS